MESERKRYLLLFWRGPIIHSPDKRAGLWPMMSSGRIWKVKDSYWLFFWHTSSTWPKGLSGRLLPYGCKRYDDFDICTCGPRVLRVPRERVARGCCIDLEGNILLSENRSIVLQYI